MYEYVNLQIYRDTYTSQFHKAIHPTSIFNIYKQIERYIYTFIAFAMILRSIRNNQLLDIMVNLDLWVYN